MGYCINSLPAKPQTSPLPTLAAEFLEDYILPAIRIQPGHKIQTKTKIKTRSFQTLMHKLILLTREVSDWSCNYFLINLLVSSTLKLHHKILKIYLVWKNLTPHLKLLRSSWLSGLLTTDFGFLQTPTMTKLSFQYLIKFTQSQGKTKLPAPSHLSSIAMKLYTKTNK